MTLGPKGLFGAGLSSRHSPSVSILNSGPLQPRAPSINGEHNVNHQAVLAPAKAPVRVDESQPSPVLGDSSLRPGGKAFYNASIEQHVSRRFPTSVQPREATAASASKVRWHGLGIQSVVSASSTAMAHGGTTA